MNAVMVTVPIGRVEGCARSHLLAVEEALEIRLGNRSLSITMRTPGNDFERAAGFLHSEGMIEDISHIRSAGRPSDGSADVVVVELVGEPRAFAPPISLTGMKCNQAASPRGRLLRRLGLSS